MKLILSKKDLFRLSESTRAEILDYLSSRSLEEQRPVDDSDPELDGFDMTNVAHLNYRQIRKWMEPAAKWTKAGLRVFAEKGPIVRVTDLVEALEEEGPANYSQFQSRTTVRTRTVTGNKGVYLLGWHEQDDWVNDEGRYAVARQTYTSLRRYFRLDEGEAS